MICFSAKIHIPYAIWYFRTFKLPHYYIPVLIMLIMTLFNINIPALLHSRSFALPHSYNYIPLIIWTHFWIPTLLNSDTFAFPHFSTPAFLQARTLLIMTELLSSKTPAFPNLYSGTSLLGFSSFVALIWLQNSNFCQKTIENSR